MWNSSYQSKMREGLAREIRKLKKNIHNARTGYESKKARGQKKLWELNYVDYTIKCKV